MICGHLHNTYVGYVGDQFDHLGQPCPVIVAAQKRKELPYCGGAITLTPNHCKVVFNDNEGRVASTEEFDI